jgi:hypothetical protein
LKLLAGFDHRKRILEKRERHGGSPRGASFTSSAWWRTTLFDVAVATIDRWEDKHPEFCGVLKRGKMAAAICGAIACPPTI